MSRGVGGQTVSLEELRRRAKVLRLEIEISSPGDNKRRYRFVPIGGGRRSYSIKGIKAAALYLEGYEDAVYRQNCDGPVIGPTERMAEVRP